MIPAILLRPAPPKPPQVLLPPDDGLPAGWRPSRYTIARSRALAALMPKPLGSMERTTAGDGITFHWERVADGVALVPASAYRAARAPFLAGRQ